LEDWYKISRDNIEKNGGSTLLSKYGNSPCKLVMALYPNHQWLVWKFEIVPKGFWEIKENQKKFMDWIGLELGFKVMDDWYKLTNKNILENGGSTLFCRNGNSSSKLVMATYPTHKWLPQRFSKTVYNVYLS
jgi:hypothetical protein